MRWYRTGDPTAVRRRVGRTEEERFWQYVDQTDGCWLWNGGHSHGYGTFYLRREDGTYAQIAAHRWSYEALVGPIPDGLTLDHMCHTAACRAGEDCMHRRCVRPDHLKPVTLADNVRRSGNSTKTHCKRGHEFTPENTEVFVNASGGPGRKCLACRKIHQAARNARDRAARATSSKS